MTEETKRNYQFGAFVVDLRAGELRKDGVTVALQEKPFRVLCALVERAGSLVTREELRTLVWTGSFVEFDHGLNVAVSKLREVLEDSASQPRFIETVPRRGYRFIAEVAEESPRAEFAEPRRWWVWAAAGVVLLALTLAGQGTREGAGRRRRATMGPLARLEWQVLAVVTGSHRGCSCQRGGN